MIPLKLNRKKIVLLSLVLFSLLSLGYLYFVTQDSKNPPSPLLPSYPSTFPGQVINFYPEGNYTLIDPKIALIIDFSSPINTDKVDVQITPPKEVTISVNTIKPYSLVVRPLNPWKIGDTYFIKLVGIGGKTLYETKITFVDPAKNPPDFDEIYINP